MIENKKSNKNIIDNFIKKELEIKSNPFLAAKVMAKITAQTSERIGEHTSEHTLLFKLLMTTAAAAILTLGVFLGSNYNFQGRYNGQESGAIALNINDSQLENLYLYNIEE